MNKRKETQLRGIPMDEKAGELLNLMQIPAMSMVLEPFILNHRRPGQTTQELLSLISTDFEAVRAEAKLLLDQLNQQKDLEEWRRYISQNPPSADAIAYLLVLYGNSVRSEVKSATEQEKKQSARKAADVLHDKPGGSRDKQKAIRAAWASGKYTSRDRCAEEECGAIGMSFSAARRALRTPRHKG